MSTAYGNDTRLLDEEPAVEGSSGVIWSAIIAGAVAIAVVSLVLFIFAAALGFSFFSPWESAASSSASGKVFAVSGALALIIIQWLSAAFGGYLTGRMRTKWVDAHTHEIFFRDTVHGFLAWTLATLIGLGIAAYIPMHAHMKDSAYMSSDSSPAAHFVGRLFSTTATQPGTAVPPQDWMSAELILESAAMNDGTVADDDLAYLTQIVSQDTGMSNADAAARVQDVLAREKTAVKAARRYTAISSFFLFFSMLIGAFIAGVAGGLGGRHRDLHYATGSLRAR